MSEVQEPQTSDITERGFLRLSEYAYETSGLVLVPEKSTMIRSRLRHRLNKAGVSSLDEYTNHVKNDASGHEFKEMISALTTNVTGFFREPHHFQFLTDNILNTLTSKLKSGNPVRVWSAGCSSGQEAYSLAMHFLSYNDGFKHGDFKILATDIDAKVVAYARDGTYSDQHISGIDEAHLDNFFRSKLGSGPSGEHHVIDDLKQLITFKELNLMNDWPMKNTFDVIFCRNVVIYFDAETQAKLWKKFEKALDNNGLMFVGHSERISDPQFKCVGATTYAKSSSSAFSFLQPR